jgi:PAS domain S-box-containing protein
LIVRVDKPRNIYLQGKKTINYFLISLILIGILFCILIYFLIEHYVISRLLRLKNNVNNISTSRDFSSRVKFSGKDELSDLSTNINEMLENLESSQNLIQKSKVELEQRVTERTSELQKVNTLLEVQLSIGNDREQILKNNITILTKRNQYEKVIRSVAESVNKTKDLQQIIESVIKSIHANINHATTISLHLVKGNYALLRGSIGYPKWFIKQVKKIPQHPKYFIWRTIIENRSLLCNDTDFNTPMGKAATELGIKSYLSVPLRCGNNAIGCLKIDSFSKYSFTIEDQNLLEIVASQIEIAINNARQAEALRQSEQRYKALFDQSPVGVYTFDKNYTITNCNERMVGIIGSSREQIVGLDMTKLKDNIFMPAMTNALNGEICYHEDIYNATTISKNLWLSLTLTPLLDNESNVIAGIAVVEDINERKNAEKNLLKYLEEKEILLKEIHHRVKNNLQIISSLLHLQSDNLKHTKDFNAEIFKESQDRIRSMALIHEKLYSSENFGEVNIKDYLTTLSSSLVRSYRINTKVKIDAENIYLNIEKSVTCGLIINELLTNSLKHAFHNNSDGQIHIQFLRQNNHYELIVKDNGTGLSEDFDIDNTNTLGLKLVKRLTQQLEGTINYEVNNGTMFKIYFH